MYGSDDFELWRARISYFAELRYKIEKALKFYEKSTENSLVTNPRFVWH